MDYKKLELAVLCEGFVESYIEERVASAPDSKHMIELAKAWELLDEAFNELRKENAALEAKLYGARVALS